jgi:hypothetical protein
MHTFRRDTRKVSIPARPRFANPEFSFSYENTRILAKNLSISPLEAPDIHTFHLGHSEVFSLHKSR